MLKWDGPLEAIGDRRKQGRIPAAAVVRAILVMCFCRLGSLNALGQTRRHSFWPRWLDGPLPSPDTIGRVAALIDVQGVRELGHDVYERLKRNKALRAPAHGLLAGVLDGHETHATYRRHCPGCLERTVHTAGGDRIQYYHRLVAISLVTADLHLMLDAEPMLPGEDEIAAALRLLERVVRDYPRAFDVVQGDALYADPRFFHWAAAHGKYALAVLKNDRRDLLEDARRLFQDQPPVAAREGKVTRQLWDLEGFTTWPQAGPSVRVVRSLETQEIRRQIDGQLEELHSEWFWATTLPMAQAPTGTVVHMGHHRWDIENPGFNELASRYHADHVYRHEPTAMLVFWLLIQLCLNIFVAFFRRNLKPAVRAAVSMLHVARSMQSALYAPWPRGPT